MTSAEMPGPSAPGRRSSVRETAPHITADSSASIQPTNISNTTASRHTLPMSPPPSPPMIRRTLTPTDESAPAAALDTHDALRESVAQVSTAGPSKSRPENHVQTLQHANRFDVPVTPEMSPANHDIHHHPTEAAEAFMRRVFVDWNANGAFQAEDAGVELVCDGWSGAVAQRLVAPQGKHHTLPLDPSNRSLYVHMPCAFDRAALRDHMLKLLDAASERVGAGRVVFCLERSLPDLTSLLHGLCYVGGQVTSVAGQPDTWTDFRPIPTLVLVTVAL